MYLNDSKWIKFFRSRINKIVHPSQAVFFLCMNKKNAINKIFVQCKYRCIVIQDDSELC